jgi:hypothetical protein
MFAMPPVPPTLIPAARTSDLIETEVDGELLVYDRRAQRIHHLNHSAAAIWRRCTAPQSLAALVTMAEHDVGAPISPALIQGVLTKLAEADLLAGRLPPALRQPAASRRALLRKAALAGVATVPVVISLTAPASADTQSLTCTQGHMEICNPGTTPCCQAPYECRLTWFDSDPGEAVGIISTWNVCR